MEVNWTPLRDEVSLELRRCCHGLMPPAEVELGSTGLIVNRNFVNYVQRFRDLEVREDDVWMISFPKCGSTWTQEMIWLLKNNIDFESAKASYLHLRCPFLEFKALNAEDNSVPDIISIVENMPSPRLIKTHLPVELLPTQMWTKKPKIVYVARNANDAAISYFHHHRIWNNYTGSQDLFLEAFLQDKVVYSPFWKHILSFWKLRDEENVHFMFFEDMKKDLSSAMKSVADFLGVFYTKDQEAALLEHLSFSNMKTNRAVNFEDYIENMYRDLGECQAQFFREGQVGAWKQLLSKEQSERFQNWTERNLKGTDYPRKYC